MEGTLVQMGINPHDCFNHFKNRVKSFVAPAMIFGYTNEGFESDESPDA